MKQKMTFFAFARKWVLPSINEAPKPYSSASSADRARAPKPVEVLRNNSRRLMGGYSIESFSVHR